MGSSERRQYKLIKGKPFYVMTKIGQGKIGTTCISLTGIPDEIYSDSEKRTRIDWSGDLDRKILSCSFEIEANSGITDDIAAFCELTGGEKPLPVKLEPDEVKGGKVYLYAEFKLKV